MTNTTMIRHDLQNWDKWTPQEQTDFNQGLLSMPLGVLWEPMQRSLDAAIDKAGPEVKQLAIESRGSMVSGVYSCLADGYASLLREHAEIEAAKANGEAIE